MTAARRICLSVVVNVVAVWLSIDVSVEAVLPDCWMGVVTSGRETADALHSTLGLGTPDCLLSFQVPLLHFTFTTRRDFPKTLCFKLPVTLVFDRQSTFPNLLHREPFSP